MERSSSSEDYMKSILILQKKNEKVRSVDVAEQMGVTKPSVCSAMKKLRERKMICFDQNGYIVFTEEGKALAEKIYRKHLLLSDWLVSVGVKKDIADREACMMEHAISDETCKCLENYILGNVHAD